MCVDQRELQLTMGFYCRSRSIYILQNSRKKGNLRCKMLVCTLFQGVPHKMFCVTLWRKLTLGQPVVKWEEYRGDQEGERCFSVLWTFIRNSVENHLHFLGLAATCALVSPSSQSISPPLCLSDDPRCALFSWPHNHFTILLLHSALVRYH